MSSSPSSRRALITGITGQDGSFLAELLIAEGYEVIGLVRGAPRRSLGAAEHLRAAVGLVDGDLLDVERLTAVVAELQPDELYHLAAPSFVPDSWSDPTQTIAAIAEATATLLVAVRDRSPSTRVFVASSSAMFGDAAESPQDEDTRCEPQSPYATAKLAAHQVTGQLRDHDGVFACSGILFNHESERRPESFVTRKVTRATAAIKLGLATEVTLGDLSAVRDWSFAGDVVRGAWLMLQQERPLDCVLASGVGHSVSDLVRVAFEHVSLDSDEHVLVDATEAGRSAEPKALVGDPTRARRLLDWKPTLDFEQLVRRMVDADLDALSRA